MLWLSVVGTQIPNIFGVDGATIGPTSYCVTSKVKNNIFLSNLMVCVHDTSVFIAISYRLVHNSTKATYDARGRMKTLAYGEYLPTISKMLYIDGQMYFLYTIGFSLAAAIIGYTTNLAPTYRVMMAAPNVFVTSSMACRIVRHIVLPAAKESSSVMMESLPVTFRHRTPGSARNKDLSIVFRVPGTNGVVSEIAMMESLDDVHERGSK